MPTRSDILFIAVNARFGHCSFAVRTLLANLGPLRSQAAMLEVDLDTTPFQLASDIVAHGPRVAGFAVYLWNVRTIRETSAILRRVAPALRIVLGGPEITRDCAGDWDGLADALVVGEGESAARRLCAAFLEGEQLNPAGTNATSAPSRARVVLAKPEDPATLELPYDLYTDADLAHRTLFVESSRGCPCRCSYCTSGGTGLRLFPLDRLLPAFDRLLQRGARHFRFLDRSFNVDEPHACRVLSFFLARHPQRIGLHLEFLPCRPGAELRDCLTAFPPGVLHLEVGIQTLNPDVARRIGRAADTAVAVETARFLCHTARAIVHADLIFGLPGEDEQSFARGFDLLVRTVNPAELQVNLLKRLPGTPLAANPGFAGLVFNPHPPYELLASDALDFSAVVRLQQFARCWEMIHNRGRFPRAVARLLLPDGASPFARFAALAARIQSAEGRLHALGADCLAAHVGAFLKDECGETESSARELIAADRAGGGATGRP